MCWWKKLKLIEKWARKKFSKDWNTHWFCKNITVDFQIILTSRAKLLVWLARCSYTFTVAQRQLSSTIQRSKSAHPYIADHTCLTFLIIIPLSYTQNFSQNSSSSSSWAAASSASFCMARICCGSISTSPVASTGASTRVKALSL